MKVMYQDMKKGEVKVLIQHMDDCWHLYNILEKGDVVSSFTYRTKKEPDSKQRAGKGEKEGMYVSITVERVSFQKFSERLRIHGTIVEGPVDLGAHHTLYGEPGKKIKIRKEWKRRHLNRLNDAVKASSQPRVVVLAMDDDSATLASIHQYGVEEIATIESGRTGKMYNGSPYEKEYYGDVYAKIRDIDMPVVIVGPGFAKDNFVAFMREKGGREYIAESVGHAGMAGVHEALKRGIVERIAGELRMTVEMQMVERVLTEIVKNGLVVYGISEVKNAVDVGAVKEVVVTHDMVETAEDVLEHAEKRGAHVHVISAFHEGGEKLAALGGIAAFLRYSLS